MGFWILAISTEPPQKLEVPFISATKKKIKKKLFLKLEVSLFLFCLALIHNGFLRKKKRADKNLHALVLRNQ